MRHRSLTTLLREPRLVLPLAAVLGATAMAALVAGWQWRAGGIALDRQIAAARAASPPTRASEPIRAGNDFTAQWPRDIAADAMTSLGQRTAQLHGLSVRQITVAPLPADAQLTRAELVVELKGTYPALKGWLNDNVNARTGVALGALELRRSEGSASADVDARVRLQAHARPRGLPAPVTEVR